MQSNQSISKFKVSQVPVSQQTPRHQTKVLVRSEKHKVAGSGEAPLWRPDERPLPLLGGQGGRQVVISATTLHDAERRVFLLGRWLQHLQESEPRRQTTLGHVALK